MLASGPSHGGQLGGGGGGWGICSGALRFTVRLLRSNHFARFVDARQILMFATPCPPSLCSGKLVVSIFVPLFLQCDGAFCASLSQGCHGYPMRSSHAARDSTILSGTFSKLICC